MLYFKILVSMFAFCFSINLCQAQYYEDDCYSDNIYNGYNSDTIIVEEYDVYRGYRGYSSYDVDSNIINHYDVDRGYSGFSIVNKRSDIIEHYENGVGYKGYSQVYLGR